MKCNSDPTIILRRSQDFLLCFIYFFGLQRLDVHNPNQFLKRFETRRSYVASVSREWILQCNAMQVGSKLKEANGLMGEGVQRDGVEKSTVS